MSTWSRLGWRLLLPCLLWTGGAAAAPAPWPVAPFQYYAKQTPLRRALGDFAQAFGLRLELSTQVEGQLNGDYALAHPSLFLDALAASYGLSWYYHGGVLYVDKASESVSRSVRVGKSDLLNLQAALTSLGIFDSRFGWGEFPERSTLLLSGPPAYVKLVMDTVSALGIGGAAGPSAGEELRVFLLKHTRADDRTFSYRDQQVTTPGMATILRGLVTGGQRHGGTSALTLAPRRADPDKGGDKAASRAQDKGGEAATSETGGRAVIEVDQRLNALIVRDTPERIAVYDALIRQLDVPTPLIEIEAMIVDVNSEQADQLGVNWGARHGGVSVGMGELSGTPGANTVTLASGSGGLLQNSANFFLAQVNALSSKGQARVLARPSVLTADNLVAVLDLSKTMYLSVVGERVADVVPVATGTLLKVTPRVIEQGGQRLVQLVVDIEDGNVQQAKQGATVPTVVQSNISTQAVVRENDSLLIGGYSMERDAENKDSVPLLAQLPVLGGLFRSQQREWSRQRRMFLIRPRIVDNPATLARAADVPQLPAVPEPEPGAPLTSPAAASPATVPVAAAVPPGGVAAAAATLPMADGAAMAAVLRAIDTWTAAWSARAVQRYLACYSEHFSPAAGLSLESWRAQRRQRLAASATISVRIEAPQVQLSGQRAEVTFWQYYRSGKHDERVRKRLTLVLGQDGWKIEQEVTLA